MRSLILIPSYLWKNTFKRWLENPSSPLSKILVPFMLGLLATLVLVFFTEVENQLSRKLTAGNSYDVHIVEAPSGISSEVTTKITIEEEDMWTGKYGSSITYLRQPLLNVTWKRGRKSLPIIVYNTSLEELHSYREDTNTPTIWLLTKNTGGLKPLEVIELAEKKITAVPHVLPTKVAELIPASDVVAVPMEMATDFLDLGFSIHVHARFENLEQVQTFVHEANAYYQTEKRNVRILSSLPILQGLEQIRLIQNYIRIAIISCCGIILAIILGTIAWLEYRQEAYLLALLRSFGTPRIVLLTHAFFENFILITLGIFSAFYIWKPIYEALQHRVPEMNLSSAQSLALNQTDASIILAAGLLGVLIAMIPIAIGLKKPTGLILQ